MSWPAATDALFAELAQISGLSPGQIRDVLEQPAEIQAELVGGWKALDSVGWTKSPGEIARFASILETIGIIAGVVSGVAGAVAAVSALRAL